MHVQRYRESTQGVVNLEDLECVDVRLPGISLPETITHQPTVMGVNATLEQVAQLIMGTQQDYVFIADKDEKLVSVISGIDEVKKILELLSA